MKIAKNMVHLLRSKDQADYQKSNIDNYAVIDHSLNFMENTKY